MKTRSDYTWHRHLMLVLLALGTVCAGMAQNVLQVASKTVERTVPVSAVRTLHIHTEKADIELVAWERPEVSVQMELSARHPDRAVATADLAKVQYVADRSGKDFYLRNYVMLKDGEAKPASNLKAKVLIRLPASCAVELTNTFGTIQLKGLTNSLRLKADFCTSTLTSLSGKGNIETSFGSVKTLEIDGTFSFHSDHTDLQLEGLSGEIRMDAAYGNVDVYPTAMLEKLVIQSKKAVITLHSRNWQHFNYNVNGQYASFKLPNGFKWRKNTAETKNAYFTNKGSGNVDINAEFGNVSIR